MKNNTDKKMEVHLYNPVRDYFKQKGFDVYGEVNHCDLAAVKENELILVELKLNLNVELLIQATKRQRLTDLVYIAIPKPKYSLFTKKWRDICHLIRRLELGLILVSLHNDGSSIDIKISPAPFDRAKSMQRNKKKRNKILEEIRGRHGDNNVGGSHKTKIMTAYKEKCIHIACLLEQHGPLSPKALRQLGAGEKTLLILNKNYYGWFDRIKRGTYVMSEKGKQELTHYPELVKHYNGQAPINKKEY